MSQSFATDYIDVAARLVEFREKYPDGSLQPADPSQPFTVQQIGGKDRIVVVAAAYRTPDDARPGIGMAYEEVPGRTPYTRDSELQNAETSAWGRAIVAALAADTKKGVASANEVRNRVADRDAEKAPKKATRGRPAQDEWARPEAPTDGEWKAGWIAHVSTATSKEQLNELWKDLGRAQREGQCDVADAHDLGEVWKERARDIDSPPAADKAKALTEAMKTVEAGWPKVAEVPA
jgi:hypothetical protein